MFFGLVVWWLTATLISEVCLGDELLRSPIGHRSSSGLWLKAQGPRGERKYELLKRAELEYHAGESQKANRLLQQVQEIDPYFPQAHDLQARIALDSGDIPQCVESLRTLATTNPDSAQIQNSVGRRLVQFQSNPQTPEAGKAGRKALGRAAELEPNHSQYSRDLAAAYLLNGDRDSATHVLTESLARNPTDAFLAAAIARVYARSEEWNLAVRYYDRVLHAHPDNPDLRRARARCLYRMGDYQRARNDYQRCFKESGGGLSLPEYVEFGDSCLRIGDYASAQAAFEAIARTGAPRIREVELLRGLCALHQGDVVQAKGIFTTAMTYWPDDSSFRGVIELCQQSRSADEPDRNSIQPAVHTIVEPRHQETSPH